MLLLLVSACTLAHRDGYTVNTLDSMAPGGSGGEFYAIVRSEQYAGCDYYIEQTSANVELPYATTCTPKLSASDSMLIRCMATDTAVAKETTCERVLTSVQAFEVAGSDTPLTFARKFTPEAAKVARGIAEAVARIDEAEASILRQSLNAEQSETVRAQARKGACALIAGVTDRPCDTVLHDAGR